MAAYVIAYLEVTDPKAFEVYRRAAGPTFGPYGGRPLVVDGQFDVLEGVIHPKSVVVVEFESLERAQQWYASPEYAKTIPLRQQAANSSLILVDGLARPAPASAAADRLVGPHDVAR
jgi:uncharacterized protein (DUF1330 family)